MADENASDVQSTDITPDDFMADEQESPKAEPSTAKTEEEKPESAKSTEAQAEETKDETEADDTADKSEEPEAKDTDTEAEKGEETETKPPTKAEERKTQLNTEIRDLVAQRNTLRTEVEKANAEVYQPATEQELVDEGMSATDAKVEAMRQNLEVRDYNERVAEAQLTIESESNRILQDFAWANPNSGEDVYKKELAEEAAALLQSNLITDPNTGQVIGSNISPYQLYKTLDRASGISAVQGQIQGQQAAEQQLANVDAAGSAAPPKKKADPLAQLWETPL
jgi:hypothetical protein